LIGHAFGYLPHDMAELTPYQMGDALTLAEKILGAE
jgi:hypothetical protein